MRSERTGEVSPAKDVNNDKIFARKIIRLFGEVTEEDIEMKPEPFLHYAQPGTANTFLRF
jgi:hypothetical protein